MDVPPLRQFLKQDFKIKIQKSAWKAEGKICEVIGNVIVARLPKCALGTIVSIEASGKKAPIIGEIGRAHV